MFDLNEYLFNQFYDSTAVYDDHETQQQYELDKELYQKSLLKERENQNEK